MRFRSIGLGLVFALFCTSIAGAQTGSDDYAQAIADCKTLTPPYGQLRWLSLSAVPLDKRDDVYTAVCLVVNQLSRSATIKKPKRISENLIRIDIAYYAPTLDAFAAWQAAWEELAAADPYYHVRTQVLATEVKADGKKTTETVAAKTVYTAGGWIDPRAEAELRELTGSGGAVLRADWFVANASLSKHYYAFAGIPATRAEYVKGLGLDEKSVIDLNAVKAANLVRSGITDKSRRIARFPTPFGALWATYDSAEDAPDKDPFRDVSLNLKFDAGEYIATLPNGLHSYALYDAGGKRLAEVDAKLAVDYTTHPPQALQPSLSCTRCHFTLANEVAQNGLRDFTDLQAKVLAGGRADIKGSDPAEVNRIAALYARGTQMQRELAREREDFAAAVLEATGLEVAKAGDCYSKVYAEYADALVKPEAAAVELGLKPDAMKAEDLRKTLGNTRDAALILLLENIPIKRKQFEATYGEAQLLLIESKANRP